MAVNGKQKGNAWERTVANFLSEKFADITGKEKSFIRNSDSGSYFGGKNQARTVTHADNLQKFGDIITPDNFRFTIEAKAYKDGFTLNSIMKQSNKQMDSWIAQAEQDADNSNKSPMLIVKFNGIPPFVMIRTILVDEFKGHDLGRFQYKGYTAFEMNELFEYAGKGWFFT